MLVTFHSKAYADITMFGEVAITLLKLMGHSGTVPSALLAEDLPAALARLREGLERYEQQSKPGRNDDEEPDVSLSRRALPLIELLEASIAAGCEVMWDK